MQRERGQCDRDGESQNDDHRPGEIGAQIAHHRVVPQIDAVRQRAQLDQRGCAQHLVHQTRTLLRGHQQHHGGQFHHRDAPDHGALVVPAQLHQQGNGQGQPHGQRQSFLQPAQERRAFVHQRRQQAARQQARSTRVETKKDLVELLAVRHPQQSPQPAEQVEKRDGAPDLTWPGKANQEHQQRRPHQVKMLFHRKRPHVQQRARAVEEGNAVVGQVGQRDQRIPIDVVQPRPEQRRHQAVGAQKQGQRGHQAQEPAPVEAHIVDAPMGLALQQQQRGDEKAAQDKKQIHAQKRTVKQRHMRVRQDHQQDGDTAQPVQGGVVAQREVSRYQIHVPFSTCVSDSGFSPMGAGF